MDQDANLIAAAQAAASWARARRATWTGEPHQIVAPAVADPPGRSQPSVVIRVPKAGRLPWPRIGRGLAVGAVMVALGVAALVGARYALTKAPALMTQLAKVEPISVRPPAPSQQPLGALRVVSTPAGAKVTVDAQARGVTPLTLTGLSPGRHEVVLESDAGRVHQTVTVAANETTELDTPIFSGWLIVYAPFAVRIVEGGRVLQPDERNQIMMSAGIHELKVVNDTLAYEAARRVEVKPGEQTILRLTPPPSKLTVTALTATASEVVEVWLDGARVGETPLNALAVALGTHEVIVKHGTGGERRFTVTIGVDPVTLNVDFR